MTIDHRQGPLGCPAVLEQQMVAVLAEPLAFRRILDQQAHLMVKIILIGNPQAPLCFADQAGDFLEWLQ